jgi:hypothetical protein
MDDLVAALAANPWIILLGIFLSLLGVIGLPLSVFLYFKSKRERLPRWSVRSNNIIKGHKDKYPAVSVRFQGFGDEISNLTVSKVILWNHGKETIRKADVIKPGITLRLKEGLTILDVSVVQVRTAENKFAVTRSQDRSSATIAFDYIDHGEGVMFQVFHTGTSDHDLTITGKVMGAGEPVRMPVTPGQKPLHKMTTIFLFLAPTLICALLLLMAILNVDVTLPEPVKLEREPIVLSRTLGLIILVGFVIGIHVLGWVAAFMSLRRKMPPGLDKTFLDEF